MRKLLLPAALLIATPALAGMPELNSAPAIEHVQESRYAGEAPRYPVTWGDEAAQSLGVKDGKWEAFSTTPSSRYEPTLSAGADSGGAMLRLSWH